MKTVTLKSRLHGSVTVTMYDKKYKELEEIHSEIAELREASKILLEDRCSRYYEKAQCLKTRGAAYHLTLKLIDERIAKLSSDAKSIIAEAANLSY